jgi:hypothetical protein
MPNNRLPTAEIHLIYNEKIKNNAKIGALANRQTAFLKSDKISLAPHYYVFMILFKH